MKRRTAFALGLCAVLLLAAGIYFFAASRNPENDGFSEINLYYIGEISGVLEPEKRRITLPESRVEAVKAVYNEYMNGPQLSTLSLPAYDLENFTDLVYPVDGNESIVKINFTKSYDQLSESKKLLCISGMVYTLTELDFIKNVYFYVEDKPIVNMNGEAAERYNRNNVANNPSLEPEKSDRQLVVLYFTDAKKLYLYPEERSIEIKQSQSKEEQIVEQLIQGPLDSSLVPAIMGDLKVKDIKTEEDICYINLSSDSFVKNAGISDVIMVYSIVDSLTELDYINKVQFLVDGEKITETYSTMDFGKTFERNEAYIYKAPAKTKETKSTGKEENDHE